MDELSVLLSRWQFALTALYHFLFVPLTLGLSLLLAIMETVYVISKKTIWRQMTKFWGLLFGINFAMGVATGITLEFQFGTNWSYYSHYIGDIFGSILAIEGLMAFFLEATLVGLFFFGWNRLSRIQHLLVTWFLALATTFSALWILIANGWMQNPVGAKFNPDTLRMELLSFSEIFFNPVAQTKFAHTVNAGYVTGALFMLAVSAYYILRNRHLEIAKRSMVVASSFGLICSLALVFLGDESGFQANKNQPMKLAAMEAQWTTEKAPAHFTVVGWPDKDLKETVYAVKIPWVLGIIATRSLDKQVLGVSDIIAKAKPRIYSGIKAYEALEFMKKNKKTDSLYGTMESLFQKHGQDLGYALLLKRYHPKVINPTPNHVQQAAESLIPNVPVIFWAFRIMVACGLTFICFFILAFYVSMKNKFLEKRWFLKASFFVLPLPWIAAESGWIVSEHGRQPWAIEGILPTFFAASPIEPKAVWTTLIGFIVFYTALLVVDIFLMQKYIKIGPQEDV